MFTRSDHFSLRKCLVNFGLFLAFSAFGATSAYALSLKNQILGVQGPALENIQMRLNFQQSMYKTLTVENVEKLYNEAPTEIINALQPYGYFKAKVRSELKHIGEKWFANYYVYLGPPLRVVAVDVTISGEAAKDAVFKQFLANFPLHKGDILDTTLYTKTKQYFFDLAARNGYIEAKTSQSAIRISLKNYNATIILHFDSGPRYFFGPVSFVQSPFSETFLKRFFAFQEGEYYSSDKMHATQSNLSGSNLFQSVSIEPQYKDTQGLNVPVTARLVPRKSQQYNLGIGYGTDTGVRGLLGVDLYNLTSDGQHFTGIVKAAAQGEGDIEAHYIIPGLNPVTDQFDISAGTQFQNDYFGNGESTLIKGGPGYTTNIWGWQQTIRLDLEHEWWHFNDQPNQQSTLLVPNITLLKSKANDPVRPTKGYRLSIFAQGALDSLGSDLNFWQMRIDGKVMYPIPRGPILVMRGAFGYTGISSEDLNKLPLSFWFTAGGAESIRGYDYKGIGPGTKLAEASLELRQKMFGDIYSALFFDTGNAADSFNSANPFYEHQGVGLAFLWLSPVGAIRLSYARAIDLPGAPQRIQFSMGPEL